VLDVLDCKLVLPAATLYSFSKRRAYAKQKKVPKAYTKYTQYYSGHQLTEGKSGDSTLSDLDNPSVKTSK